MQKQVTNKKGLSDEQILYIVIVGLMAALCFVGNYLQIKIPSIAGVTRVHFGNSMCLLSGLFLGGIGGGLASGIGAGLYDLFDPAYVISAPFTFLSKFAMGYVCGELATFFRTRYKGTSLGKTKGILISAISGQIVYIILYFLNKYIYMLLIGSEARAAFIGVMPNLLSSVVNAVIAVAVSVPLYIRLKKPLGNMNSAGILMPELKPHEGKEAKRNIALRVVGIVAFILLIVGAYTLYVNNKLASLEESETETEDVSTEDDSVEDTVYDTEVETDGTGDEATEAES